MIPTFPAAPWSRGLCRGPVTELTRPKTTWNRLGEQLLVFIHTVERIPVMDVSWGGFNTIRRDEPSRAEPSRAGLLLTSSWDLFKAGRVTVCRSEIKLPWLPLPSQQLPDVVLLVVIE